MKTPKDENISPPTNFTWKYPTVVFSQLWHTLRKTGQAKTKTAGPTPADPVYTGICINYCI